MGKKSLFQSTSQSKKNDRQEEPSAAAPEESPEMTTPPAPETAPPKEPAPAAADTGTTAGPAAADPSEPPRPKKEPAPPEQPAPASSPRPATGDSKPAVTKAAPCATPSAGNASTDSLDDNGQAPPLDGFIKTIVAVVGGLLLLIFLASLFHANNYYVRQSDGAVEIWKGTFTPAGKERLLILHGADWDRPEREVYDKKTVYTFAAGAYAAKALALAGASGLPDYNRIDAYLERSLALFSEIDNQPAVDTLRQVQTYLDEAAILDASGEKEAMALAGRRLDTVQHALSGVVMSTRPQEKKSEAPAEEGSAQPEAHEHK